MAEEAERADRRRRFGTVIARRRGDGSVSAYLARYSSPVDGRRVQRSFGVRADADAWLRDEEMLVELSRRGVQEWVHPTVRERRRKAVEMTFGELADLYVQSHRRRDGSALRGGSLRNLRTDVGHLKDVFGDCRLTDITPERVSEWYFGEHDGLWVFQRCCQRLKAIMELACSDRLGAGMPLLERNPFILPVPPDPEPRSWSVPPLTGRQVAALYEAMPEYDRLSVLLAVLVGGMRIGEACALTVGDFDFDACTMEVNHSVCRGDEDAGPLRLGPVKSRHSKRVCVLPSVLVPLVREHIETRRDQDSPYVFQGAHTPILAPTTLGKHFRKARKEAGCPDATFRTLRVTHTTLLMQAGGTLREAMDSIGDSTQQVVLRHYTRTIPEHQRAVVGRMTVAMAGQSEQLQRILRIPAEAEDGGVTGTGTVVPGMPDITALMRVLSLLQERVSAGALPVS